jgi:uncharacterized membrane protein YjfL (UPF0719 family)
MRGVVGPLAQVPPPVGVRPEFDLLSFLLNASAALLWSVAAALIFTVIIIVTMRLFTLLTPNVNELEELRKGNLAVALVMAGFILAVALVVVAVLLK